MPYVFFDTETTGISTPFVQILEFGAIKTDDDLNEIDRFFVRCRLLPHIVPSPGALLVTGITPDILLDEGLPSHYEAIQEIRRKLMEWSPAVFIGYNSFGFDEEILRQAFFQTLHPPYLTNTNGNVRSDAMRIMHAAHIYQPNTISVPADKRGRKTFRLDKLAPANGYVPSLELPRGVSDEDSQVYGDVEATIFMARLVKERANQIWENMERFRDQDQTIDFMMREPCFSLSERYFGRIYSWLVTFCGQNPNYKNQIAVFDTDFNPEEYLQLSVEELTMVLNKSPKAIRVVTANRQPIMMSAEEAPGGKTDPLVSEYERKRRIDVIRGDQRFVRRVGEALSQRFQPIEPSPYRELQIYDGSVSWEDQDLIDKFHEEPWETRIHLIEQIQDPRLVEFAHRLVYFERPELLSDRKRKEMDEWRAERIVTGGQLVPWMDLSKAFAELRELEEEDSSGRYSKFLKEVRKFLMGRGELRT